MRSIVKSFSVGNGDTFYIKHASDSFTMIDCNISDTDYRIVEEIKRESKGKSIHRFISTHPDEDHIHGLEVLDKEWGIVNFYCVENTANKMEKTPSFIKYCSLRDDEKKSYYVSKHCKRRWLNLKSKEGDSVHRGSAGIDILWPDINNEYYREALEKAGDGESPNNISPIILYSSQAKFMWMGDLETEFIENIKDEVEFDEIDVLFAPHHGRKSGHVPKEILRKLNPKLIVIGEAPSDELTYYSDYNTITQNTAGDITFVVSNDSVDVYVGKENYKNDRLIDLSKVEYANYIGSFWIDK